jgi:hypothetical protein
LTLTASTSLVIQQSSTSIVAPSRDKIQASTSFDQYFFVFGVRVFILINANKLQCPLVFVLGLFCYLVLAC